MSATQSNGSSGYEWPLHVIGRDAASYDQRGARGFSDDDTFSFDSYLAGVIAGGVRALQERGIGCPGDFMATTGMTVEERTEKWRELLGEMAEGFEAYLHQNEHGPWLQGPPASFTRSWDLLTEWFGALWD